MSWFKVDDNSAFNAKVLAAGNEAWGAFCRVGAWCAQQLTDGRFSRAIAVTIAPMRVWERLKEVGLVDPLENGEMEMHDYLQRNPSKEQVLRERSASKDRMNAFRRGKRYAVTLTATNGECHGSPVPSRPVQESDPTGSLGAKAPRKRRTGIPEGWKPDAKDIAFAKKRSWSDAQIAEAAGHFADHHEAKGSVMSSWNAAWRTWVRRDKQFSRAPAPRSGKFPSSPPPKGVDYPELPAAQGELERLRRMPRRMTAQDTPGTLQGLLGPLQAEQSAKKESA